MVLKKPYAFLIKHFKIIHLGLLLMIIFVTVKYNDIVSFFSNNLNNNIKVVEGSASVYISSLIYVICLIIMAFSILMFLLMKKKNKPSTLYIFIFIYYFVIISSSLMAYSTINSLADATITEQTARVYKDLYLILSFPNYYFVLMSFIRGFGFDVKKFNFSKDLEELEIKSEDNEEFEFVLGTDSYKYKRFFHRFLREIKYYFQENKLMISIVLGTILFIVALITILNINVINKEYGEDSSVTANGFIFTFKKAYVTQKDYNGNIINKNKKYIICDFIVKNISYSAASVKLEKIFLTYGKTNLYYNSTVGDYFNDLGKIYTGGLINANSSSRVLIVFEIPSSVNQSSYTFSIISSASKDDNGNDIYKYIKYKINPINLDKTINNESKKINDQLILGNTTFANSNLIVKNIDLVSSYEFKYDICEDNAKTNCKSYYDAVKVTNPTNQKLLVIDYTLNLDENALINNSLTAKIPSVFIFDDFVKIKYKYGSNYYISNTKSRINEKIANKIFVDVPSIVSSCTETELLVNTRYNSFNISFNTK